MWTDGSRIEGRAVGAVVFWWERAHTPPWSGPKTRAGEAFRPPYHPRRVPDGWAGKRFHLEKNKEAFDAELFTFTVQ